MTWSPVSLPVEHWPEVDRDLWRLAQAPAAFLEPDKPASQWTPDSQAMVEWAYGRWLGFLDRSQALDPSGTPGERATKARLGEFVVELQARVSPVTTAMMVGGLLRMLAVLEPKRDWTFLQQAYRHLKRTATPSRDKLSRMVSAAELFDLGLRLMDTWDAAPQPLHKATRYRNGLLIALLICCPIRLKNLAGLVIGRHLICDGNDYRIELTAEETKTGRPHVADLPRELSPYIDHWLQVHRPTLQLIASEKVEAGGHLWIDCRGNPMSGRTIQRAIAWWTEQTFGKAIRPHLFRDCAVTELVDVAPEQVGIAADLLGHADFRTTRKHYIQAHGMTAHLRVQEMIARRRAAARG